MLLYFDGGAVCLTQRQLVAAHGDFHGIAERRDLADKDGHTLGDAHVHDAALDRALAMQTDDRYRLTRLYLFQALHRVFHRVFPSLAL